MKNLSSGLSIAIQICFVVAIAVGARSLTFWYFYYDVPERNLGGASDVANGAFFLTLGVFGLLTGWVNMLCCSRQGKSPEGDV